MIENLRIATYRFTLQVGEQGLELPPWKASTFRGGFGHVFKRLACMYQENPCDNCQATSYCAYSYIFETSPNEGSDGFMGRYDQIPRPYLLEVPTDRQTLYEPGELLTFRLRLFGKAIDYAPLFITTFRELGKEGIGKGRKPYRLIHVECEGTPVSPPATVYIEGEEQIHHPVIINGSDIISQKERVNHLQNQKLTLFFETPLRMKWQGRYTDQPDFHVIYRNILRRVTGLLQYHHDVDTSALNIQEWIRKAEQVQLVGQATRWIDYDRFSARQDVKMKIGGIVGWAHYEGDVEEFIPWLRLAEIVHVGKNTVFDLGRVRVG